jgi:hypothetical protein
MVISGGLSTSSVIAAPDQTAIVANCRTAQSILGQVEKTDAVSRINRGRAYSNVLDLFFAMNARLASNKIAAPHLAELTSEFEAKLAAFRDDYDRYDDSLMNAVEIDCAARPVEFYERLTSAREQRNLVAKDVEELNQLINDYRDEFNANTEGTK